jgi:hypothetical protein
VSGRPPARDGTPVANRLLVLQLVRVLSAISAILIVVVGEFDPLIVPMVLAYVVLTGVAEIVRRWVPQRVGVFVCRCCSTGSHSRSS